jgi:hypothetical protein
MYDPTNNILITFAGAEYAGACNSSYTDAVWTLSHANGTGGQPVWTQLATNAAPVPRFQAAAVYNTSSNKMTIFAGFAGGPYFSDLWVLSSANGIGGQPTWTQLQSSSPFGKPVGRYSWNTQAIDITNNRMMITLGLFAEGPLWSTWVLSPAD